MASQTGAEEGEGSWAPGREGGLGASKAAKAVGKQQHLRYPRWGSSQAVVL